MGRVKKSKRIKWNCRGKGGQQGSFSTYNFFYCLCSKQSKNQFQTLKFLGPPLIPQTHTNLKKPCQGQNCVCCSPNYVFCCLHCTLYVKSGIWVDKNLLAQKQVCFLEFTMVKINFFQKVFKNALVSEKFTLYYSTSEEGRGWGSDPKVKIPLFLFF